MLPLRHSSGLFAPHYAPLAFQELVETHLNQRAPPYLSGLIIIYLVHYAIIEHYEHVKDDAWTTGKLRSIANGEHETRVFREQNHCVSSSGHDSLGYRRHIILPCMALGRCHILAHVCKCALPNLANRQHAVRDTAR